MGNLFQIIKREYLERVRRKSFIITTILAPVLMLVLMFAPAAMLFLSGSESKTVAVIDNSNRIAPYLKSNDEITFERVTVSLDSAKNNPDWEAVLVIGDKIMDKGAQSVDYYMHESTGLMTEDYISDQIETIIEDQRIEVLNMGDIKKILDDVKADVSLRSFRIGEEDEGESSAGLSYFLGLIMEMALYMFIILYGQMVMTSIIEEKNNRVLEVVVSSVSPNTLMMGKILGIGAVAITQILIWALLVCGTAILGLPAIMSGVQAEAAGTPEGLMSAMSLLAQPSFIIGMFGWMTLFLIGGYLFYSAIYAAIGSAVDNIQDASQLQTLAIIPVLAALILSFTVVNDPNSTLALWLSYIPFTSPLTMMMRLPFGVPVWQSVLSLVILGLSVLAVVWIAAKIYRVGIFMYGKKPTIKDLARWARYK